ncbi:MAG: glycosyltransferase family 2 protein [Candidatus Cloacimonetes bacterium]|nr:glycosyltransferase family 2 protein [Candidatus Cloacimonadota bacterium]
MKANWKNTAVVVPIYNSEKYLIELFERINKFFPKNCIFAVNDASTDNSKEICQNYGVSVLDIEINRGKGYALQTGFQAALEKGFNFAFSIDSDLQHKPEDFPLFIQKQNQDEEDIIIGKRSFSHKQMPFHRICSNKLTSKIVTFATKQKILDSQCGFRLYNLELIKGTKFQTERYQFETEVIFKFAKKNGKIVFVPIETIYAGQKSYISGLRDIKNFVRIVISEIKS